MSIATKTGDGGTTALMFNRRVSKTDMRVAAYGACDELNVAIGMARAWNEDAFIMQPLEEIQKELVTLMGELDMTAMRAYFVKPQAVVAMGFVDDPMQGLSCDSFSGSSTAKLETTSFVVRTAALR